MAKKSSSKKTAKSSTSGRQSTGKRERSPSPDTARRVNGTKRVKTASAATVDTEDVVIPRNHDPCDVDVERVPTRLAPIPNFTGNFDLYDQGLGYLSEVYRRDAISGPHFEDLYNRILSSQAKSDRTAQVYLTAPNSSTSSMFFGEPHDPMVDAPFENIALKSIKSHENLAIPKIKESLSSDPRPGISASIALSGSHSGVQSLSGTFRMRRLWTKPKGNGTYVELFEGHVEYKAVFSALYKSKRLGKGCSRSWAFWGVRAAVGPDGLELGICKGIRPTVVQSATDTLAAVPPSLEPFANASSSNYKKRGSLPAAPRAAPNIHQRFKLYEMYKVEDHGLELDPFPSYAAIYEYITDNNLDVDLRCDLREEPEPKPEEDIDSDYDYDDDDDDDFERFVRGTSALDPFTNRPFHFTPKSIKPQKSLSFSETEIDPFYRDEGMTGGPGAIIELDLPEAYTSQYVYGGDGKMKFVHAWSGVNQDGHPVELFEVFMEYRAAIDAKAYKRMEGGGVWVPVYGDNHTFWAISVGEGTDEDGFDDRETEVGCGSYDPYY